MNHMTKYQAKCYSHASMIANGKFSGRLIIDRLHLFVEEGNELCEFGVQLLLVVLFVCQKLFQQ